MLMRDFNVSFNNADTIVRTEMAHLQTQAAMQRYKDYGITEVEILADKDERQCEVCGKLHKKRYPTGANVPIPAHPRCRCSIIPVVEDKKEIEILAKAGYNDDETIFDDGIDFDTNEYVQMGIKEPVANFVTKDRNNPDYDYGVYARYIKPLKDFYDVKAHGTYKSIVLYDIPINSKTLARILLKRRDYANGRKIRLLSCNCGKVVNGTCFAQELADLLGVEVIAPRRELVVNNRGKILNMKRGNNNDLFKGFKPRTPKNDNKK